MSTQIEIRNNIAIININGMYDLLDVEQIMMFYMGMEIQYLRAIVFNCKGWDSYNVIGGELYMMPEQFKTHKPEIIFCGLNSQLKPTIDWLGENMDVQPIFFETLEQGLAFTEGRIK